VNPGTAYAVTVDGITAAVLIRARPACPAAFRPTAARWPDR